MLNIGFQTLGNDAISMASSLLSGNSIEAAKMVFFFGMVGGFIGANVAK
ncbi:unknown [Firmicutes bacterium CAG:631]|nr:unknown [Firmicutes bacterium CAG:631]